MKNLENKSSTMCAKPGAIVVGSAEYKWARSHPLTGALANIFPIAVAFRSTMIRSNNHVRVK